MVKTVKLHKKTNYIHMLNTSYWKQYNYWNKFEITYTNRIYKFFLKKKFVKMLFNFAHPTILYKEKMGVWNFINHPYEKTLITWYRCPKKYFQKNIQIIINVRKLNYYTWRGLYYSEWPWTKKIGKVSEYV